MALKEAMQENAYMRKTKWLMLFFLLLTVPLMSYAQKKPWGVPNKMGYDDKLLHFGFSIAYHQFNFSINSKADLSEYDSLMVVNTSPLSGFGLGIVTNLRMGKYFDLRFVPGLSFGDRVVNYTMQYNNGKTLLTKKNVESVYLDVPLLVKFKSSRMHNFRVFVMGGAQYSMDLISAERRQVAKPKDILLKLRRHDIQGQAGVGFEIYFNYFKLTTEFKMSFGFIDLLYHEDNMFSSSISSLKTKNTQISFIFE